MPRKLMRYEQIKPEDMNYYIDHSEWHMQQKLDGIRCRLVFDSTGKPEVIGSNGGPLVSTTAAPVVRQIEQWALTFNEAIPLEGEIIGDSWWLFDLPIRFVRWEDRLHLLWSFVAARSDSLPIFVKLAPTCTSLDGKHAFWEQVLEKGVEGVILKHVDGTVEDTHRRSKTVLKCKITHTVDVVVTQRGPNRGINGGNWLSFGAFERVGNVLQMKELGRCSTIGKPFADVGDVIEVKYLYCGAGGKLVQPTHLRNRPDKDAKDCWVTQLQFVCKEVVLT